MGTKSSLGWVVNTQRVRHKKTHKEGTVIHFTGIGKTKPERVQVEWDDGTIQWCKPKVLKRV